MISIDDYKKTLSNRGRFLGEVRKIDADRMVDKTFDLDHNTRIVYVQVSEEEYDNLPEAERRTYKDFYFHRREAKYQRHAAQSILADNVDYYLQFRPGITANIGRYVIVPDEQSFEPDFDNLDHWWLLVLKNDLRQFPRYMILKCNWNFEWIHEGRIYSCLGCLRNASSYTSGIWTADISTTVDNITSAWLPDTPETQTINYDYRFMISVNKIHPHVYKVSKYEDTIPQGVIKLVFKQDFFNKDRDNIELRICDYYDQSGNIRVGQNHDDGQAGGGSISLSCKYSTIPNKGSYRVIKIDEEINFSPVWSWSSVMSSDKAAYSIVGGDDSCKIIANRNINLIGDTVTVSLSDGETDYSSIALEVI